MAINLSLWLGVIITISMAYLLTSLVRKYIRFRRDVEILKKIPGMEPEFLFGNARQFPGLNEAGLQYLQDQMLVRPRLALGWMGPFLANVNVCHPDTVKVILRTSEPKSRNIYGLVMPWLGEGLLVSNGDKWARSRRLLTPAFHFDILKSYLDVTNMATNVLLNKMEDYAQSESYFEAFSEVSLFSLDVILQTAFSMKTDCQTAGCNHPYIQAVTDLNELLAERFFQFWLYSDFLYSLTPKGRKFLRCCDYVHKVAEDIIKERRQTLRDDAPCRDFLGILLTARDTDGRAMTSQEIRNEVDTFLFEGHDTTTSGIAWTLYSIAKYPDIQRKMQAEIDEVMAQRSSDEILWQDLSKFPYTTMVLKESMRHNAPVLFIQRVTSSPLKMDGYDIPVGTTINIVLWALLNNHTVWENPRDFNPERFLPENVEKRDPFAYVPFSAGPRNCIGQNFAMNEMKTVIVRILKRFTLELDPNHKVERKLAAVMKSQNGIRIKAISREKIAT